MAPNQTEYEAVWRKLGRPMHQFVYVSALRDLHQRCNFATLQAAMSEGMYTNTKLPWSAPQSVTQCMALRKHHEVEVTPLLLGTGPGSAILALNAYAQKHHAIFSVGIRYGRGVDTFYPQIRLNYVYQFLLPLEIVWAMPCR